MGERKKVGADVIVAIERTADTDEGRGKALCWTHNDTFSNHTCARTVGAVIRVSLSLLGRDIGTGKGARGENTRTGRKERSTTPAERCATREPGGRGTHEPGRRRGEEGHERVEKQRKQGGVRNTLNEWVGKRDGKNTNQRRRKNTK